MLFLSQLAFRFFKTRKNFICFISIHYRDKNNALYMAGTKNNELVYLDVPIYVILYGFFFLS